MDAHGMLDRMLAHGGAALAALQRALPLLPHSRLSLDAQAEIQEAANQLQAIVRPDGSYVPREIPGPPQPDEFPILESAVADMEPEVISALTKPLPSDSSSSADDLLAGTITISYPGGRHTFHKTGPDQWKLSLETPEGPGPDVTGYDNGNVLRVVAAFLTTTHR